MAIYWLIGLNPTDQNPIISLNLTITDDLNRFNDVLTNI